MSLQVSNAATSLVRIASYWNASAKVLCGAASAVHVKAGVAKMQQQRYLSLHEYQSKNLMEKFGLKVQTGQEAATPEDAAQIARRLKDMKFDTVAIKCQVLAGGRGKGTLSSGLQGGVKVCSTVEEVKNFATQMLGYKIRTHQTTEDGEFVKKVLVVAGADIEKELYLALIMDRAMDGPVAIVSQLGGVDIEEVAKSHPDAIKQFPIDIAKGMTKCVAKKIADALGFSGSHDADTVVDQLQRLYELFISTDAIQVEINPFAIMKNPKSRSEAVSFIDAKFSFDDNAAYRQKELFSNEDKDSMDPRERAAEAAGLNFVGLDGNVGCLVNGAGLAMSTMDIIKLHGGQPANFLDVGGGADEDQVTEAFRILKNDPNVKVLFVNIFGGIMKCDTIAQGLVAAAKSVDLRLPLVVRLVGNRVDIAKQILKGAVAKSKTLNLQVVDDFELAAKTVVALSQITK